MAKNVVISCDVGLATFGYAVAELMQGVPVPGLLDVGAWATEKSNKKLGVLSADDDLRRVEELDARLGSLIELHKPAALIVERKSLPRNASAAGKISLAWGSLLSLKRRHGLPLAAASPQEVRRWLGLTKGASKLEVQAAVVARYPHLLGMLKAVGVKPGMQEHPVDAVAALLACLGSEVVRAVGGRSWEMGAGKIAP